LELQEGSDDPSKSASYPYGFWPFSFTTISITPKQAKVLLLHANVIILILQPYLLQMCNKSKTAAFAESKERPQMKLHNKLVLQKAVGLPRYVLYARAFGLLPAQSISYLSIELVLLGEEPYERSIHT